MKKIPLEPTIVGAYRFLFTNIVSIVGTLWLPFVVVVALIGGLVYLVVPHAWLNANLPVADTQVAWQTVAPIIYLAPLVPILILIFVSMMLVGLMRHSLGLKKTTTFIYFSLGATVWRMVAALFLTEIVLIVLAAVLAGIFFALHCYAVPLLPHGQGLALSIALGVIEGLFFIYAIFRLYFFVPAVVVAENKIGLGRSWHLGGGNFWRIVIVLLLIVIPVAIIAGVVIHLTVFPFVIAEILKMPPPAGPAQAVTHVAAFLHALIPVLPLILVVALVQRLATLGLLAGAMGTAYNAVTAPDEPAAAPAPAPVEGTPSA